MYYLGSGLALIFYATGSSIAEIVSAFPTCGGLYTASAQLCPPKHRAIVGWFVGWLNVLGESRYLLRTVGDAYAWRA